MQDLNIAVIQDAMDWQDPAASRARYDAHFNTIDGSDLVVLPEMFSTGFYMEPWQCYEEMNGETVLWMQQWAQHLDAVITGSLIMKIEDRFVNRMIWARPDGSLDWYDKKHLFRFGGEHHNFSGGDRRVVMTLNGWRVALFICYDLRFPVWSRNRLSEDDSGGYDLALYVANWPDARQYAWDSLVRARAIENQAFTAGCNRLGKDGAGNTFSGGSVILDFKGMPMIDCANRMMVARQTLSMQQLIDYRQEFPAAMDADTFTLNP